MKYETKYRQNKYQRHTILINYETDLIAHTIVNDEINLIAHMIVNHETNLIAQMIVDILRSNCGLDIGFYTQQYSVGSTLLARLTIINLK
jgi:hypothetical protein